MGHNATFVVMNDALNSIMVDRAFGAKVAHAINRVSRGKPIDIPSGIHVNAAAVIEQHHADEIVLVAVGGNEGRVLTSRFGEQGDNLKLLKAFAESMGYEVRRKPKARR